MVSLVPTTLQRLLDAGLRDPPALRWALLGGAPATDALQGARRGRGRAGRADLRADRGVLAGHHARARRCSARGAHRRRRRDPRQRPDRGAGRRARARHRRPGRVAAPTARCASLGRKADTIVSGGENVAPAEVEAVLEAHPDVVEAAVHGRADPEWGEAVVATVVAAPDVEAEELRAWCAARLAIVQGAQGRSPSPWRCRARASGKLARRDLQMSDEREELHRPLGRHGRRLEGHAARTSSARSSPSRSGWSTRSTRSRATACSSWRRASATPACWPPQRVAPGRRACSSPTAPRTWSPRRASTPRRSGRRTSNYGRMQAEWIDLPTASVDGVLCRFGYMLLVDPEAALRETRRVLKPGGRVALAVWDDARAQPVDGASSATRWPSAGLAPAAGQKARARSRWAPRRRSPSCSTRPASTTSRWRADGPRHGRPEPRCLVGSRHAVLDDDGRGRARAWRPPSTTDCVISSMRGTAPYVRDDGSLAGARAGRWSRRQPRRDPARAHASPQGLRLLLGSGHRRRRPGADLLPRALARPGGAGARGARGAAALRHAGGAHVADGLNRFLPDAVHARHPPPRARHARQLAAAARPRAGRDAVDDVGRDRRHRALRVAHPRLRPPRHRRRAPAQHGARRRASR